MRNFHSIRPLRLLLNPQNNLSYSDSILMKSCIFNLEFKSPSNSIFLHYFEGVNPLYFENYCYWWERYCNLKCILISHLYFLSDNFYQFSSVQSLSHVSHFPTPWTSAHQASRSITNSQSLLKLMSIELVISSNHPILCCPLLLWPSIIPSTRLFSNELVYHIRWPKYWSFSFNISPSNEYSGQISFRKDWLALFAVQGTLKSLLQHHSSKASILQCSAFFIVHTWPLEKPYICINILYWCFSFWITSLCIIGSSFIHLIRTDWNAFFLLAE